MPDKESILSEWYDYLDEYVSDENIKREYTQYISNLVNKDLPVIFNLQHLAALLGVSSNILARAISRPEKFYRNFEIPKRSGGSRQITAPYPFLLLCQRWINVNILNKVKVSDNAHGFVSKRSIITNAQNHANKRCILKLDIENFFPSIKINRIIAIFNRFGYSNKVSYILSRLCCLNNSLPQGAATSPTLSNIITKRLDARLAGFASRYKLKYTRYADDMTFSGLYIPVGFQYFIKTFIEDEGFKVNKKKSKLIRGFKRKIITGISVSKNNLNIPKEVKRKLRQEAHYLTINGFINHTSKIGQQDPLYIERLLGKFNFWLQVEPKNKFAKKYLAKIKQEQRKLDDIEIPLQSPPD